MGVQIRVGKFEANLPAFHTLPVREAVLVMTSTPEQQPFLLSQLIMRRLTWLQRKRFESLTAQQYSEVLEQWLNIKGEKK